jgi:hypothetical protein
VTLSQTRPARVRPCPRSGRPRSHPVQFLVTAGSTPFLPTAGSHTRGKGAVARVPKRTTPQRATLSSSAGLVEATRLPTALVRVLQPHSMDRGAAFRPRNRQMRPPNGRKGVFCKVAPLDMVRPRPHPHRTRRPGRSGGRGAPEIATLKTPTSSGPRLQSGVRVRPKPPPLFPDVPVLWRRRCRLRMEGCARNCYPFGPRFHRGRQTVSVGRLTL